MKKILTLKTIIAFAEILLTLCKSARVTHCKFELDLAWDIQQTVAIMFTVKTDGFIVVERSFEICSYEIFNRESISTVNKWGQLAGELIIKYINAGLHYDLLEFNKFSEDYIEYTEIKDVTKRESNDTQSDVMQKIMENIKQGQYEEF